MNEPTSPNVSTPINSMETKEYKEILLSEAEKKLNRVKFILYAIAIVQLVLGLYYYFQNEALNMEVLIIQSVVAALFFGLAFLVNKKPRIAVISALVLYLSLLILNSIADPGSIINGLLLKGLVIYAFVVGIKAAKEAEDLRTKLGLLESEYERPLDMIN